ncbi:HIT domain-containing protein [Buchnera aphidicola (Thelaxes californica)]|uniref:HIT domain-containing protein n=1 Tax=Buchnera aphidicola (Thelaxes californica) TaxID=1315998 RepID=A0A4D6YJS1_9GAMM|nr:HIT domain-containing protein [Buchnera aphidicola]QCI26811.1 HIT domain-containing protein [Buchnera aphidicola (Thelaxes californica)]
MIKETIFSKIINTPKNKKILYQNKLVTVFEDKQPQALIHLLIVSNTIIHSLNEINKENNIILLEMMEIAIKMAKKMNIDKSGYRIIINCKKNGGQEIPHLHIHLLGGEFLGPILHKK